MFPPLGSVLLGLACTAVIAALAAHAQTPTNLVDGLIMEGKHKIMPKHGGLQELKEAVVSAAILLLFSFSKYNDTAFLFMPPTKKKKMFFINGVLTTLLWKCPLVHGPIRG